MNANININQDKAPARLTLTQSENLKLGERGVYVITGEKFKKRCDTLKIKTWVEKRKATVTAEQKAMRTFIDLPFGYSLVYGITFNGKDYDCGDMPRDLGTVVKGIEIANPEHAALVDFKKLAIQLMQMH